MLVFKIEANFNETFTPIELESYEEIDYIWDITLDQGELWDIEAVDEPNNNKRRQDLKDDSDYVNEGNPIDKYPNMACTQEENSYVTYDERGSSEDPTNFGNEITELILDVVEDCLNDEWFTGTTEDGDDLDCIIYYLELQSHDDFVDNQDES
ncbi:hypothetical protein Tco_0878055 [Tanacetum coccineum]|uniref:Uncharacterized protein n=1 Tax=Tanacetum coccineum TaxID=301880 RepID=A0ABQ5C262_9ASTR